MRYFDLFPKVAYDINGKQTTSYENVTNIFFRLRIIRKILTNISAYYEYTISEGDTPEILAEKIYGDIEAHWIIMMANDIVDAQYDWPLTGPDFPNYLIKKYDSIQNAHTTVHHYERVIRREETLTGIITESRFQEDETTIVANPGVPYYPYDQLAEEQEVRTINMGEGRTVIETIYRERISCYDWEDALNESKRQIKIIKPEYYPRIISEFHAFTDNAASPFLRRLT